MRVYFIEASQAMTEDKASKHDKDESTDSSSDGAVDADLTRIAPSTKKADSKGNAGSGAEPPVSADDPRTRLVDPPGKADAGPELTQETELISKAAAEGDATRIQPGASSDSSHADRTERLGESPAARDIGDIDRTERVAATRPDIDPDATEVCKTDAGQAATRVTGGPDSGPSRSGQTTRGTAASALSSLTVGSVLRGRFRITGVLGEGGMGAVYSAVDMLKEEARDENVNVALKVMKPDIVDAELSFMGLQREARRAQQLAHPNIVTVYDFDRADGVIYMTMEFMRGKPLDAVLEDKPHGLDLVDARDITTQICKGLAYAHKEGIVHSDLKPQNVFLLDSGRAKILDFGIARAYQAKKVDMIETVFAGYSPAFASPEVIARKSPSPGDDVFALGLLVYQLFTGRHPFDWVSADKAVEQGLKPKRDKAFKRAEWAAVQAALSFDGTKRPQDAAEFLKRFAPSRVRQLVVAICLASVVAVGAYTYFYDPVAGPDVPFEELPLRVQTEITRNLGDAEAFLGFGDIDSAFQLYDAVLITHPGNLDATAGIHEASRQAASVVVDAVRSGRTTPEAGRQTLESLMAYETLPSRSRRELSKAMESL